MKKGGVDEVTFTWDRERNQWTGGAFSDDCKVIYLLEDRTGRDTKDMQKGSSHSFYCEVVRTPVYNLPTRNKRGFKLMIVRKWRDKIDIDEQITELEAAIANGKP